MRVIGGHLRGRHLPIPKNKWPTRPTTDFAREALFNILENRLHFDQIRALDLFGGTGIHSVEMASRGCTDITYVEQHRACVKFVQELIVAWNLPIKVVSDDAFKFLRAAQMQWDYIFADPPYDMQGIDQFPVVVLDEPVLAGDGLFVLEHRDSVRFEGVRGFQESRHYGQSRFSFFTTGL